ncbi:MAG: EAL domain-containing protein [Ruminococcus sp.]|nr:EAL domain-containing protein [Ruminococcus sp.]
MGRGESDHSNRTKNAESILDHLTSHATGSTLGYVILLILYIAATLIVNATAGSHKEIVIAGAPIGEYTFAGVFSALSNICILLLVANHGKIGFYTALIAVLAQLPPMFFGVLVRHNFSSIPGFFTSIFTLIAVFTLNSSNKKAEKYQEKIREQAVKDSLTGLPNRFACEVVLNGLIESGVRFALVIADLKNFKSINDTMGHETGNSVLFTVGKRLKEAAESSENGDFVARMGGDEFAVVIQGYGTDEELREAVKKYAAVLEKRLTLDNIDYFLSACFGYAEFPFDTEKADTLYTYADAAMYEAKQPGSTETILRFAPEMLRLEQSMEIEQKVRAALDNDTIFFALQPQFDLSHRLRGFEALARMKDADGNFISPGVFIPAAERAGMIDKVDLSVFRKSAAFFGMLIGKTGLDITLSINVSVRHLMKNGFLDEIKAILDSCGVPASQLEIEITESVMIESAEKALQCISSIHDMGMKIAIDDFGTGYSSLSYLNSFPADLLKIDKSFIDKMNSTDKSKQYVAAMISIGHIMNFKVISEGVEQPEQLETLREIGCDYIQGFIWGKPLTPEDAEKVTLEAAKEKAG